MWTVKTLIRLGGCPGWSESSLGAHAILLVLSCAGSIICFSASGYINTDQSFCCCLPIRAHSLGGNRPLVPGCLHVWEDRLAHTVSTPLRCYFDLWLRTSPGHRSEVKFATMAKYEVSLGKTDWHTPFLHLSDVTCIDLWLRTSPGHRSEVKFATMASFEVSILLLNVGDAYQIGSYVQCVWLQVQGLWPPVVLLPTVLRQWSWCNSYFVWLWGFCYGALRDEPCFFQSCLALWSPRLGKRERAGLCAFYAFVYLFCTLSFLSIFSSSWCQWLAADYDCCTPWTFLFNVLYPTWLSWRLIRRTDKEGISW